MNGRRMLWTTLIGAAVAMTARLMNRRQTPARRLFRRIGRGNSPQWIAQPVRQMVRRMAR